MICNFDFLGKLGLLAAVGLLLAAGPTTTSMTSVSSAAPSTTRAAVTEASTARSGPDLTKEKVLYVVGYAHLDTQWRWAYPQVIREFIPNTMNRNFALFEKYPHYVFNFSGSRRYQFMKEYYPEDYAQVKHYVATGQWFPCGSSVDENDANVPSAESIIRQVLYGNHYFRKEFGVASDEYMLPDCFGFPYALPSILAHCGIKGFSTQKLTWGSPIGIPFNVGVWEGPDGQQVIAALDPGAYTGKVTENLAHNESWLKRVEKTGAAAGVYTDYHYFGTGDRGGAPGEDSVEWIEKSVDTTDGPMKVICTRADAMFNAIPADHVAKLPRYKGELLLTEHSAGSITSQAYMKRWNRKNELLADDAERASVAAAWLGGATYPSKKLEDAWTLVLGSQMHDMLPGTSIPKAYEFCWNDEILASNQFAAVARDAVGAISQAMDTRGQGTPLVVYNPLSIERTDVVEATIENAPASVGVFDPSGNEVPSQVIQETNGAKKIAFLAHAPSVGWAVYDVRPGVGNGTPALALPSPEVPGEGVKNSAELRAGDGYVENARYKVTLASNGDVASIFDKKLNKELLASPMRLAFQYESPNQYPAWNMDWKDRKNPPSGYVEGPAAIRVVEKGPARATIEVTRQSQGSTFTQKICLSSGGASDRIDFVNDINWQTREHCLKAVFPLTCANPTATYQIQVGVVERGNNSEKKYEFPQHQWFDMTDPGKTYGVSVLNDCKYGSDKPDDRTVRLTMVYTPHARSFPDQNTQDIGRHHIVYSIYAHDGDWRNGTQWQAARVNQPLVAFATNAHEGALGKEFSLAKVSSDQVEIQAMKKAEDSDEVIVRLKELSGKPASGVHVQFASPVVSARLVDGQERPLGDAKIETGQLVTDVPAFRMMAFAVKCAAPSTTVAAVNTQSVDLPFDTDVASYVKNPGDGAFDSKGRSLPAEQLPAMVQSEGVRFAIGPMTDGKKNAVACRGQTIALPTGNFDRLYLLAAADGDRSGDFDIDEHLTRLKIQNWTGYVGQWDNRSWEDDDAERGPKGAMIGLTPGYVKPATVAWFCSHLHSPEGGNEFYQYSYLFKYALDVPSGARRLTLPNDDRIKILAVSAVWNDHNHATPAAPLFDTLEDHVPDSPTISGPAQMPSGGFADSIRVTVQHGLYWHQSGIHYTTDGSEPTSKSPEYKAPILLASSATVKAKMFNSSGEGGATAATAFDVHDTTPPAILSATAIEGLRTIQLSFSEPLEKESAETVSNYQLEPGEAIESAHLGADGTSVILTLAPGTMNSADHWLTVRDIKDRSQAGNAMSARSLIVSRIAPVFSRSTMARPTTRPGQTMHNVANLPIHAHDAWTINVMVKADQEPANRTLIAGFGQVEKPNDRGRGRYLSKFANGIHFWSHKSDGESSTPMDIGKWQMLTATYDGEHLRMYKNAELIGEQSLALSDDEPTLAIAPREPWDNKEFFHGELRDLTIWNQALPAGALEAMWQATKGSDH